MLATVLGNIGPRTFLYGPCCTRSILPRPQANIPQYGPDPRLVNMTQSNVKLIKNLKLDLLSDRAENGVLGNALKDGTCMFLKCFLDIFFLFLWYSCFIAQKGFFFVVKPSVLQSTSPENAHH